MEKKDFIIRSFKKKIKELKNHNNFYYNLIKQFRDITGVPILLNTSFNENEPIVSNSEQALDCFLRTKMDILILENYVISR